MSKSKNVESKSKQSGVNFEKALQRLEEIVADMENADPDLDKALGLFTEGVELVKFCSTRLSAAKKQVEILVKENDTFKKEKFDYEEN